ncbi:hypothetical protein CL634_05845, partial [bacterium]|nr:hypothetical protein [bacterium]
IRGYLTSAYVFGQVVALFGMFILGLAFINLVPKHVVKVKEELVKRPWSNILVGLGVAVLTPIVVVLLLITLIGAQLALLILTSYLILLFWLARVYAGIAIGMLLMKNSKSEGAKGLVWPMVLGLAVYVILGSIPIIGWVAKFLVVLWGIGGLVRVEKSILADWR